ncbi:hypothetical protein LGM58_20195 [Burkholderia contaminans]|uniref:hypothetical protein n=1 Tax=Burkholderia contaminans TaxID=488447 RepID=UPI001CF56D18|nr:hypothetical protein [Burkholderia contaminans]MCA7885507.1 hypothetical protein [Burkholderia contaminans]
MDQYGYLIRTVVEVGDHAVRGLRYSDYMKSYIDPSLGQPIGLGVQRVWGSPTVFAVALDDGTVKYDAKGWLVFLLMLYVAFGIGFGALAVAFSAWFWLPVAGLAWLANAPLKALRLCRSFAPLGMTATASTVSA